MGMLSFYSRPMTMFDPSNPDHRKWFAEFMIESTWGNCPVRFDIDEEGELISIMKRKLLIYYAAKEFGNSYAVNN